MTDFHHLLPQCQRFLEFGAEKRVAEIQNDSRWVDHPQAETVFKTVDNMLAIPSGGQAPCLLVCGDGGTGKSSIIRRLRSFPKFRDQLIYVDLAKNDSIVRVPKLIAEALGAPYELMQPGRYESSTPVEIDQILKLRKIKGIVLDELHDAFLVPRAEQQRNLSFIKGLTNYPNGISVFGFGTLSANNSIKSDPQFYRRFSVVKLSDWSDSSEFRSFLLGLECQLPIKKPSFLDSEDISGFILERTGGRMDAVVKLLRAAACYAIRGGEEQITIGVLKKAFSDPWGY